MNKKLFQKIVLIVLAILVLFALIAPAIFGQTGQPRQEKLLNGLKVLMWPDTTSDKVSVRLRIHSGSAFDPQGKEGLMQMLADSFFPSEAAREYFTDDLGGSLDITSGYDYIEISASSKPSEYLSMLETIASVVANPPVDKETTTKLKAVQLQSIAKSEADPAYVADHAVIKRMFGTFPYGRSRLGTTESISKIEYADLVDAKSRFLTADNATLAISGNFPRAQARTAVSRYFGAWLKSDKKVPSTFRQPDEPPTDTLILKWPKPDVEIARVAYRGFARGDKELPAALVFFSIVSDRLEAHLREQNTPEAFAQLRYNVLPGIVIIGFSVEGTDYGIGKGKKPATDLVVKAISGPVTEKEFQYVRTKYVEFVAKMDPVLWWLDADTYKIADPQTDARTFANPTITEVRAFGDKVSKLRPVSVFVTSSSN